MATTVQLNVKKMVQTIFGVSLIEVGDTVHPLRTQTLMEGHVVKTTSVPSMAVHTPGAKEMQTMIGTTVASYRTVVTYLIH